MATTRVGRIVPVLLFVAAFLALPGAAQAQSSTFVSPFAQTFTNPCTAELVDVTGSTTTTVTQTLMPNGDIKVDVGVVTKGQGIGQLSLVTYLFKDSQTFSNRIAPGGLPFTSTFTDKLVLRGPKSIDNWIIRVHLRLRVDELGNVIVELIKMTDGDLCRG